VREEIKTLILSVEIEPRNVLAFLLDDELNEDPNEKYYYEILTFDSVSDFFDHIATNNKYDLLIYALSHNNLDVDYHLDIIRAIKIDLKFNGAFLICGVSIHTLERLGRAYPLYNLVDGVFDLSFRHGPCIKTIGWGINRYKERKNGQQTIDPLWTSWLDTEKPSID
jgi:hypothetical protein